MPLNRLFVAVAAGPALAYQIVGQEQRHERPKAYHFVSYRP
jgi:hypothetical protein